MTNKKSGSSEVLTKKTATTDFSSQVTKRKNCIHLSFFDYDGKQFGAYAHIDENLEKILYLMIGKLSKSMRDHMDIPLFFDVRRELDGSILGAKFNIDKVRLEEMKAQYGILT